MTMVTKIVSGGQTGADRGGLDAAIHCELPHGGWCPQGRKAEDEGVPEKYDLNEMSTADYLARTEANVVDSDATVIFTYGELDGGSRMTAEFARKYRKPWLHIDLAALDREAATQRVTDWLKASCPAACVLNVAGSRASKASGIETAVMVRMVDVISSVNGKMFYPLADTSK